MAVKCPKCGHMNRGDPETCKNCGELLPLPTGDTLILQSDEPRTPVKKKAWQSAGVGSSRTLRVHIDQEIKEIHLPPDANVTLGRKDPGSTEIPDVDLYPYDAVKKGVSRLHTKLRLHDNLVQAQDLNSTNGTFLNEQKVSASEWRIVRHGDELRLGHLTMKVYFVDEESW